MEKKIIQLTNAVYHSLEFFPESDPLKNRAKDKVLEIMESVSAIYQTEGWASFQKEKVKINVIEDVEVLLGYLWIARSQGWLSSVNYLIISSEYEKIVKELKPYIINIPNEVAAEIRKDSTQKLTESVVNTTETKQKLAADSFKISDRQQKIVDFLRKYGKAQVMELQKILPQVTKRTIRRDLDELLEAKKIERFGEFNLVFYKLK